MIRDWDFFNVFGIWPSMNFDRGAFSQIVTIVKVEHVLGNTKATPREVL